MCTSTSSGDFVKWSMAGPPRRRRYHRLAASLRWQSAGRLRRSSAH